MVLEILELLICGHLEQINFKILICIIVVVVELIVAIQISISIAKQVGVGINLSSLSLMFIVVKRAIFLVTAFIFAGNSLVIIRVKFKFFPSMALIAIEHVGATSFLICLDLRHDVPVVTSLIAVSLLSRRPSKVLSIMGVNALIPVMVSDIRA